MTTAEQVEEYQRKEREKREAWTKANIKDIRLLKRKLMAIGGTSVSPQPIELIQGIVRHGDVIRHPVILRAMEPTRCHYNVSELWLKKVPRSRLFALCHGYALTDDGMWRPHSWALSKTAERISIIETTVERSKYFGVIFSGDGADWFAKYIES